MYHSHRFGLLVLGLSVKICIVQSQTCRRGFAITTASPSFLCSVDVTVTHTDSCTVHVTERLLFPYTTGRDARRSIQIFGVRRKAATTVRQSRYRGGGRKTSQLQERQADAFQIFGNQSDSDGRLRLISYRRNGAKAPLFMEFPIGPAARLVMPTTRSMKPVMFELQYDLADGVGEAERTCRGIEEAGARYMSWKFDAATKEIDFARVHFIDQSGERVSVERLPGYTVTAPSVAEKVLISRNRDSFFTVFAKVGDKNSAQKCMKRSSCIFISWKTILKWSPILLVLVLILCLCSCCSCGGDSGSASKVTGQHNQNEDFLASAGAGNYD